MSCQCLHSAAPHRTEQPVTILAVHLTQHSMQRGRHCSGQRQQGAAWQNHHSCSSVQQAHMHVRQNSNLACDALAHANDVIIGPSAALPATLPRNAHTLADKE